MIRLSFRNFSQDVCELDYVEVHDSAAAGAGRVLGRCVCVYTCVCTCVCCALVLPQSPCPQGCGLSLILGNLDKTGFNFENKSELNDKI